MIKNTKLTSILFHSNNHDIRNNPHIFSDDFQLELSDIREKIYLHDKNLSKVKRKKILSYGQNLFNKYNLGEYAQNEFHPYA